MWPLSVEVQGAGGCWLARREEDDDVMGRGLVAEGVVATLLRMEAWCEGEAAAELLMLPG
jgi:hypothetical protein